jgi:hypothetical protein
MKLLNLKNIALTAAFTSILVLSCKKNDTPQTSTTESISPAKKTNILKKEAIKFTYNKPTEGLTINWSVTPNAGVWLSKVGNDAYFKFARSGNYRVYARRGSNTDSTDITVSDSTTTNPQDTTLPGGGGNPIDTSGIGVIICNTFKEVMLGINTSTSVVASTRQDSGAITKLIDVNVSYALANGCQNFNSIEIYDSTPTMHYVHIKGYEQNCPNTFCTQAVTYGTRTKTLYNVIAGTHYFYFNNTNTANFTRQVVVQ